MAQVSNFKLDGIFRKFLLFFYHSNVDKLLNSMLGIRMNNQEHAAVNNVKIFMRPGN